VDRLSDLEETSGEDVATDVAENHTGVDSGRLQAPGPASVLTTVEFPKRRAATRRMGLGSGGGAPPTPL
jgi:hypothetical protein